MGKKPKEGKKSGDKKFPEGFFWGTATASYQVEGNCLNDWTEWEKKNAVRLAMEAVDKWEPWQKNRFPEMLRPENYISGRTCDHYQRYEEDFDLIKSGGQNAYRFSLEWSRIEPEEGKFNQKEIEHYRQVLLALKKRKIEPFVTLWHWTEPVWFGEMGGWANKKSVECFVRFSERVTAEYKDLVKFWVVVNEPNVSMVFGYYRGTQPPGRSGIFNFLKGFFNLFSASEKVAKMIKKNDSKAEIGMANSIVYYEVRILPGLNDLVRWGIDFFSNYFLRKSIAFCTFIGCNYYSCKRIIIANKKNAPKKRTDLGWEIFPEGIYFVLKSLKKYKLPIYITENGLADSEDKKRISFIFDHLDFVHKAISEGVDVRGYFHWSLLDNFEFPEVRGFWPRFGLVRVDFQTQKRFPRPSFYFYKKIAENNSLINKK